MAEYIERSKVIELLKSTEVNGTPRMKRIVKAVVDLAIEVILNEIPTLMRTISGICLSSWRGRVKENEMR